MKLSDIRTAAEAKFGGQFFELEDGEKTVRFRNALRLSEKVKAEFEAIEKKYEDARGIGSAAAMRRDLLLAAAENRQEAKKVLDSLTDDADILYVYEAYQEFTTGEARSSQTS